MCERERGTGKFHQRGLRKKSERRESNQVTKSEKKAREREESDRRGEEGDFEDKETQRQRPMRHRGWYKGKDETQISG